MQDLPSVAAWVRTTRIAQGLSQAEAAQRAGVPRRSFQRLEAADPGAKLSTLMRVFGALGFELDAIASRRPTLEELETLYGDEDLP